MDRITAHFTVIYQFKPVHFTAVDHFKTINSWASGPTFLPRADPLGGGPRSTLAKSLASPATYDAMTCHDSASRNETHTRNLVHLCLRSRGGALTENILPRWLSWVIINEETRHEGDGDSFVGAVSMLCRNGTISLPSLLCSSHIVLI